MPAQIGVATPEPPAAAPAEAPPTVSNPLAGSGAASRVASTDGDAAGAGQVAPGDNGVCSADNGIGDVQIGDDTSMGSDAWWSAFAGITVCGKQLSQSRARKLIIGLGVWLVVPSLPVPRALGHGPPWGTMTLS